MACIHGKMDGCAVCDEIAKLKRAVEFAEYMAKSAEYYTFHSNSVLFCYYDDEEPSQEALEALGEALKYLRNDIYEFRKRKP